MNNSLKSVNEREIPLKTAISQILQFPEYSIVTGARIEINSNHEAIVENCRGVLEYTPNCIRLITAKMTVKLSGRQLCMGSMSRNCAVITGVIDSIEFISLG